MPYKTSVMRAFSDYLKEKGSDFTIYKNWAKAEMSSAKSRAIKISETLFQFPLGSEIEKNNVIQQDGENSFWIVSDVEEETYLGTVTSLNVKVIEIRMR